MSLRAVLPILNLSPPVIPVLCDGLYLGHNNGFPLALLQDVGLEWRDLLHLDLSALEKIGSAMCSEPLADDLVLRHQFVIACFLRLEDLEWHQELWNLTRKHFNNERRLLISANLAIEYLLVDHFELDVCDNLHILLYIRAAIAKLNHQLSCLQ